MIFLPDQFKIIGLFKNRGYFIQSVGYLRADFIIRPFLHRLEFVACVIRFKWWWEDIKFSIDWEDPGANADYEECSGDTVGEGKGK